MDLLIAPSCLRIENTLFSFYVIVVIGQYKEIYKSNKTKRDQTKQLKLQERHRQTNKEITGYLI